MQNSKKILGLICLFFALAFFPLKTEARTAVNFSKHCSQNNDFNSFAAISSIPPSLGTPLVRADDGGWVAIYEIINDLASTSVDVERAVIEVEGTVNDYEHAVVCSGDSVIAIVPTYKISENDTNSVFKIKYTLRIDSANATDPVSVSDVSYFTSPTDENMITESYDWNNPDEPFVELAEIQQTLPSISENYKDIVGGFAYHEIYATYNPNRDDLEKDAFSMENYSPKSTLKYAIFPPLETISSCNASSLAILNVDDIKCFPMERQVEFRKYFLGLPESIQLLFDFESTDRVDETPAPIADREFIVNYFNGKETDLGALPTDGEYLTVSNQNGRYRYFRTTKPLDDADLKTGLTSHVETCGGMSALNEVCYANAGCEIDKTLDIIAEIGTLAIGADVCSGNLETDVSALVSQVKGADSSDPKIQNLADMNTKVNDLCEEIQNEGSITKLQAVNASSIAITQYLADLDSRYEGFGACEKISAINTLSGLMDRTLEVLSKSVPTQ